LAKLVSNELKLLKFTKKGILGEKVGVIGIPTYHGEYT